VSAEYGANFTEPNLTAAVAAIDKMAANGLSGSLARDLVSIIVDTAAMDGTAPEITPDGMTLAYKQFSGFAQQIDAMAAAPGRKSAQGPTAARVT